ncbi:MAG: hypothetical protein A4C66_04590 [Nitrospira sp. HN-bin3]|uniref:hypothetical protein n=1 Tax=Nitrospira cf. moscoviensis SBR1015 TaxID=96242 RepID=UPI000A0E1231|nr:hypothetical protein [Nitrospira cf. moscoviensis SBR1015]MBH0208857.1 hypothetical protein [Nitrospira sp.]OQW31884.1 MAG: hypothetical protein A4C66_04590 [Nitrospira sp. HN-bin3]
MTTASNIRPAPAEHWVRIPNGTRVRHRSEAYEGIIDGLTEIVSGSERNPDGKTQYRVKVEEGTRLLVPEQHLNILTDANQLVLIGRESELYRRSLTDRLRAVLPEDRFVAMTDKAPVSRAKAR